MDNVENPWENPFSLQSGYNYGLHTVPYIRCTKEIGSAPPSVSGGAPCGPGLLHLLRQPTGNHLGPPKTAVRFWGPNYFMDHVGGVNPPTLRGGCGHAEGTAGGAGDRGPAAEEMC